MRQVAQRIADAGRRRYRVVTRPYYTTIQHASFADMLATVRQETIREQVLSFPLTELGSWKITNALETSRQPQNTAKLDVRDALSLREQAFEYARLMTPLGSPTKGRGQLGRSYLDALKSIEQWYYASRPKRSDRGLPIISSTRASNRRTPIPRIWPANYLSASVGVRAWWALASDGSDTGYQVRSRLTIAPS